MVSDENIVARAPEFQDGDKYAHLLAANLPEPIISRLSEPATNTDSGDAQRDRVTLAVVRAECEDTAGSVQALGDIDIEKLALDLQGAIGHALGAAFARKQDDIHAVPYLKAAVTAVTDSRELVLLHILLGDSYVRLGKTAEAQSEWETIQHAKDATKDEKKDAHKKADALKSGVKAVS
jgi:hypothetical protein